MCERKVGPNRLIESTDQEIRVLEVAKQQQIAGDSDCQDRLGG